MRASDADRERVAAILRRHYEAGRLDDHDLERRLTRALAARTLGQLREQVSDLPAPPPSVGVRVRYGARALRHPAAIVVGLFFLLALIGAVAGQGSQTSASGSGSAPAVASATAYPSPPADHITNVRAGGHGVDDGMAARVRRVARRAGVTLSGENGARMFPHAGHEFAVVDVEYSDRLSRPISPFCGRSARLYSRSHIGYDPVDREYQVVGNEALCGGGIQPDETAIAHLIFDVPQNTRLAWIDVWNGDIKSPDILGHTRLRMHLDGVPGA
jgi:uncharacterized protein DUF1707